MSLKGYPFWCYPFPVGDRPLVDALTTTGRTSCSFLWPPVAGPSCGGYAAEHGPQCALVREGGGGGGGGAGEGRGDGGIGAHPMSAAPHDTDM